MKIAVYKIEQDISKLKKLIDDYIDNYNKMYTVLKDVRFYWSDNNSLKFSNAILTDKKDILKNITELNDIYDVFCYMVEEYKKIGEKIKIDLNNRNKVNVDLDKYINKLNAILNIYNSLDLQYYNDLRIYNEKQNIVESKDKIEQVKKSINGIFDKVENIEDQINNMLSKINLKKVSEMKVEQYI